MLVKAIVMIISLLLMHPTSQEPGSFPVQDSPSLTSPRETLSTYWSALAAGDSALTHYCLKPGAPPYTSYGPDPISGVTVVDSIRVDAQFLESQGPLAPFKEGDILYTVEVMWDQKPQLYEVALRKYGEMWFVEASYLIMDKPTNTSG